MEKLYNKLITFYGIKGGFSIRDYLNSWQIDTNYWLPILFSAIIISIGIYTLIFFINRSLSIFSEHTYSFFLILIRILGSIAFFGCFILFLKMINLNDFWTWALIICVGPFSYNPTFGGYEDKEILNAIGMLVMIPFLWCLLIVMLIVFYFGFEFFAWIFRIIEKLIAI